MFPILFTLGSLTIYTYGFFLTLGFLLASFLIWREAKKICLDEEKILDYVLFVTFGGFVGARLLYVFTNWSNFYPSFSKIFMVWNVGGFSAWGAFLGGLIFALLFFKKNKWPIFYMLDLTLVSLLAAQVLERLGALLAGFSLGKITSFFMGVNILGVPGERHPLPFYQALIFLVGFIILNFIRQKKKEIIKEKTLFFGYAVIFSLSQWMVILFGEQTVKFKNVNLTLVLASIIMLIGFAGLIVLNLKKEYQKSLGFHFLTFFDKKGKQQASSDKKNHFKESKFFKKIFSQKKEVK